MGHWSLKWGSTLHDIFHHQETTASTWTATMIETGLQAMIQLWEQRNGDVQGKPKVEQKQKLLERQKAVISDLLSRQHRCLPKDRLLFPSNPSSELLDKTSRYFYIILIFRIFPCFEFTSTISLLVVYFIAHSSSA